MSPAAEPAVLLRRRRPWGPWLAAVLGLACFANSLPNGLVYDDQALVVRNPRVRNLTNLRDLWLSDWWRVIDDMPDNADTHRDRLYRPLTLFSFALNYAVHGLTPAGYHAVNVLLHAAVCALVWHFARRLTADDATATLAAVLFAVHPVHVEAVANVVGRAEVLAALFLLIGLLLLRPARGPAGLGRAALAGLAFLAALASKETAVCYPAVAVLTMLALPGEPPRPRRWWLMQVIGLLLPLLVYLPVRYVVLEQRFLRAEPPDLLMNALVVASPWERVLGAFTILGHYTRLLIAPARLCADYGYAVVDARTPLNAMTLLGFVTAAGGVVALLGGLCGGPRWRLVARLMALLLASYVLISNTALLIGVTLAERLMYWPSVPALILIAFGIVEFGRRQCAPGRPLAPRTRLLRALGVLLIVALGLRTAVRNTDWRSNRTLFERDVLSFDRWRGDLARFEQQADALQRSAHLNKCYAVQLVDLAQATTDRTQRAAYLEKAEAYLSLALAISPAYPEALAVRGQIWAEAGEFGRAIADLEAALRLDPEEREARRTLTRVLGRQAGLDQRLAELQAAVIEQPEDAELQLELGRLLVQYAKFEQARPHLRQAVAARPTDLAAWRALGQAEAFAGASAAAIEIYQHVLELDPDDWEAHANLVTLLSETDPVAALRHARRAYELNPNDIRSLGNLAEALALNDDRAAAIAIYQRVERGLDPNDPYRPIVRERIEYLRRE